MMRLPFFLIFLPFASPMVVRGQATDKSAQTQQLIGECRHAPDALQPAFSTVAVVVPVDTSDFSDNYNWEHPQVTISRRFIYWALESLHLLRKKPDLKLDHIDYGNIDPDTVEVAVLGVLCHEYGHFLNR